MVQTATVVVQDFGWEVQTLRKGDLGTRVHEVHSGTDPEYHCGFCGLAPWSWAVLKEFRLQVLFVGSLILCNAVDIVDIVKTDPVMTS